MSKTTPDYPPDATDEDKARIDAEFKANVIDKRKNKVPNEFHKANA